MFRSVFVLSFQTKTVLIKLKSGIVQETFSGLSLLKISDANCVLTNRLLYDHFKSGIFLRYYDRWHRG